ncbi:hypothetical protein CEXT_345151 [Caerostris extrusa]|uniref:Uncharacterized protein n=1 Tax=Caerostris extrusa TaxID=172846 RepID=A0AAV4PR30_CAEEX|nr:hypothetical protein CEXT_345151 [Caerostris extrusa]
MEHRQRQFIIQRIYNAKRSCYRGCLPLVEMLHLVIYTPHKLNLVPIAKDSESSTESETFPEAPIRYSSGKERKEKNKIRAWRKFFLLFLFSSLALLLEGTSL